ncbi:RNA 3'-terminal phosphate cyclase [Halobellus sp. GM3]|uniref:RNA 3'-terminal phosphate cyclase n=1 Tax=Halobellus sp. GM3 TaxID=3458410 RepID=UPI00403DE237
MLELDGTDGGGQLVRTALTLSALDGVPFRMENVRGDRPNPGLKRQHRTCVELLATLADADVSGADVGSETLVFEPNGPTVDGLDVGAASDSATLDFDVGTAGSVTLVADTVLPLAARLESPVRVRLAGGTDVKWSPPTDYLRSVKLPLLRSCGLDAAVDVTRRGFYPAGGGGLVVDVRPSAISPLELPARGSVGDWDWTVHAVASAALEDADVADRMAESAAAELSDRATAEDIAASVAYGESRSPGGVVTIVAERPDRDAAIGPAHGESKDVRHDPRGIAGFAAYAARGVPSEDVASEAVDAAVRWCDTDAPVDAHLGDQLVVWLALAGGRARVPRVTDHVRTNVDLVRAFGYDVSIEGDVEIEGPSSGGSEATLSAPVPS